MCITYFCAPCELMQEKGPKLPDNSSSNAVILGAGFIGLSFAAVLVDAGWSVTLSDPDPNRLNAAKKGISDQKSAIGVAGLLRGGKGLLKLCSDAGPVVADADLVIECGPENLEIKQAIFAGLLETASPNAVLATASSAIPMSQILTEAADQAQCLVAHPVNPPSVLRVVELAPAPGTTQKTIVQAETFFSDIGFSPVVLGFEIEGFILNRLQGAVLREAYRLVDEGISDVEGIDTIMRLGLGPRWALSGPFETAELNTPGGILAHAARLGPAYKRMGESRGETVDWNDPLLASVASQRRAVTALEDLPNQAAWRASAVARLIAVRDDLVRERDE